MRSLVILCAIAPTVSSIVAQIPANHAVVLTRRANPPLAALLDVDLSTGRSTAIGRFNFDTSTPRAVHIDPINGDLIVAVARAPGSRILRLRLVGLRIGAQRLLGDVAGGVTGIALGDGGDVFVSVDGANGGLYRLPRNGGRPKRIVARPRATALFISSLEARAAWVVQSGRTGPPAIDPANTIIELRNGTALGNVPMKGYRPVDIRGFALLPNAIGTAVYAHANGTIARSMAGGRPALLNVTPRLPAGATRAIRLQDTLRPIILGGKAHPRLKTLNPFAQQPAWQMLSGDLPGDPVDFDVTPTVAARVVSFGQRCRQGGMQFGASGGPPRIGNSKFTVVGVGAAGNSPTVLALGVSDQRFGRSPLPLALPGGCLLLVSVDVVLGARTSPFGVVRIALPVPNDPRLVGTVVYAQWAEGSANGLATGGAGAVHLH